MVQSYFQEATNVINFILDHGKEECYTHNQYIYQAEDVADYIYVVKSGLVIINRMLPDGKELSMKMLGHRSMFGATTLFCGAKKHSLFSRVKNKATVVKLDLATFEASIFSDEVMKYEWMLWLQNESNKHEYKLRDLLTIGKKGALYSTLIRLVNSYGVEKEDGILLNVELTNHDLANLSGTTREGVNRMISELKKENIIQVRGKLITIKNIEYLKIETNCENCPANICRIE